MQIQFETKRVDGVYEAALLVDGKFTRSGYGKDLSTLFAKLIGPLFQSADQTDGSIVSVQIGLLSAVEVARGEARHDRQRKTQEAEAEAQEIEKLTAAVNREKAAIDAAKKASE